MQTYNIHIQYSIEDSEHVRCNICIVLYTVSLKKGISEKITDFKYFSQVKHTQFSEKIALSFPNKASSAAKFLS